MRKDTFIPQKDTSYSAGLAYIITGEKPELILVLQRKGEVNQQKTGPAFIEQRSWKIPMGHFNPTKDQNLLDTAVREFEEETGLHVDFKEASVQGSARMRISSQRPGYTWHEDVFYLMSSATLPDQSGTERDAGIESVQSFALHGLPLKKPVQDALLARGHRTKLATILSSNQAYAKELGINTESLIKQLVSE